MLLASLSEGEVAVILSTTLGPLVLIFFYSVVRLSLRSSERIKKLALLQEAVRSGLIDDETKVELLGTLRDAGAGRREPGFVRRNFLFIVGWLGLFLGVGLFAIGDTDTVEAGIVVGCLGFALVSLPLAIREIEARRRGVTAQR